MPRENDNFVLQKEKIFFMYEKLEKKYPDQEVFNIGEVSTIANKDRRTVLKSFNFKNNKISKLNLAEGLVKLGG